MNERTIRWAWGQNLPSTHKLVLLALAHLADATGQCSPSISSLAALCSVSTRTVRRALRDLEADSLLTTQTRLRPDGSVTSNQYAPAMTGGQTMSPAPDTHVIGPGHLMAGVDVKAGPGAMGRIGMATHQSGIGAAIPSDFAGDADLRNVERDRPIRRSLDHLNHAEMLGTVLESNASPPPTPEPTLSTSSIQAAPTSAPTTEKPFAYLRSVIGG